MEAKTPARDDLYAMIGGLVREHRDRCLWFAPKDYQPQTDKQRLQALEHIQKHGDRRAFVRARELQHWLLQASSAK